jgi:hypothetical protein
MSEEFVEYLSEQYRLSKYEIDAILNLNPDSLRKLSIEKLVAIYGDIIEEAFKRFEDSCTYYDYDEDGQIIEAELDIECLKRRLPVKIKTLVSYLDDNMKALEKAIRDVLMSNIRGKRKLKRLVADKEAEIDMRIKLMIKEAEYEAEDELMDMDYLHISIAVGDDNTLIIPDNIDIKEYLNHMLKFFKNKYEPEVVALIKNIGTRAKIISDYNGVVESVLKELEKELNDSIIVSNDEDKEEVMTMSDSINKHRYKEMIHMYRNIISVMVGRRLRSKLETVTTIAGISVVDFTKMDPEVEEYTAWVVWKPRKSPETTAKTVG